MMKMAIAARLIKKMIREGTYYITFLCSASLRANKPEKGQTFEARKQVLSN